MTQRSLLSKGWAPAQVSFWALLAVSLTACSHAQLERDLQQRLAEKQDIDTPTELRDSATKQIEAAPGLDATQKQKLLALREDSEAKLADIQKRSVALRSVLMDDLRNPAAQEKEIKLIRKRLSKLADERLDVFYDSVDRANRILGRDDLRRNYIGYPYPYPALGFGYGLYF